MAPIDDDVREMQRWLAQGLGRAVLHLETHDSAPYRDLILNVCLYDERFSSQGEPDRAPFLYDVLVASGHEDYFRTRILAALANRDNDLDLDLLGGLLLEWARRGDAECRRVLYQIAGELADQGWRYPAERLIDLDGWDGFVVAAEQLGAALLAGADEVHTGALNQIKERLGEEVVAARLAELRASNHLIDAYLRPIGADAADTEARWAEYERLMELDYWQLTQRLTDNDLRSMLTLRRWAREHPDAPWPAIAAEVLTERDPARLANCLAMFTQIEFPLGHAPLLPLLWSDHERVASAAVEALEWFEHPAIRAEGLAMLAADHFPDMALRLLASGWQPGDYAIVEERLRAHESIEELHELGLSAQAILDKHQDAEAAGILLYLYEHGPCAFCRRRVVELLLELAALPAWMRYECGFDANPDIRALVRPIG